MSRVHTNFEALRVLIAIVVAVYVFIATMLLAKGITGNLWVVGYWIALLPVAVAAGWFRLRPISAITAFIILTVIQYVAVTIGSGASFNGPAQDSAWYTPLLTTLIFAGFIGLLNVVPVGVLFMIGTLLRRRANSR